MLAMMAMAKLFSAELREEALRLLCPRHKDVKPKFCSADDVPHFATVERHDAPGMRVAATL